MQTLDKDPPFLDAMRKHLSELHENGMALIYRNEDGVYVKKHSDGRFEQLPYQDQDESPFTGGCKGAR